MRSASTIATSTFLACFLSTFAFADNPVTLVTKDGHTYYDVAVITNQCTVDEATLNCRDGIAKVAYTNMYGFDREKFCYNLDKFKVIREARARMIDEQDRQLEREVDNAHLVKSQDAGSKGGGRRGGRRGSVGSTGN